MDSILIANRGEIACRVIRSAKAEGLRTVAVYTTADACAPHVALADDKVLIGDGPVGDSYLNAEKILAAAQETGAQAIHPGYGFLSENADFAEAAQAAGLTFVGPSAHAIRVMGDKAGAKAAMIKAGVPCVPGYEGADQSDDTLIAKATTVGFPIMVKASAGGGGRGMRRVDDAADLAEAISMARSEAENAFGSGHLILERAIDNARHVEIQVFADSHGNCIHLGERDCSVQRRHQKVIEEAPCPVMTPELRAAMGEAAVKAAQAVDYCGAGTVEFLLDDSGAFYFLEMNTRLQVEHPVTEMVTGLDLVALQLQVAAGAPLGLTQDDITLTGHAIEVRLYAEDPANDFLPAIGQITGWTPPSGPGVRVDGGIVTGQKVSPFYDPMLAKLIAHGPTRDAARKRLIRALQDTGLLGVANNRSFLIDLLSQEGFASGSATTAFMAQTYPDGVSATDPDSRALAVAAVLSLTQDYATAKTASPLTNDALFGLGAMAVPVDLIHGETHHAMTGTAGADGWQISGDGWTHLVAIDLHNPSHVTIDGRQEGLHAAGLDFSLGDRTFSFAPHRPWEAAAAGGGSGQIAAPMPGLVISVDVAVGDHVEEGQTLAVIEAMKMQHKLTADVTGTVQQVALSEGDQTSAGQLAIVIEETA